MVVVDTGPLVAAAVRSDPDHERCASFFSEISEPLVVPQLVVTEAAYLVGRIVGPGAEATFLRALTAGQLTFAPFELEDLVRAADLIERYADLRIGTVDAVVIATAERMHVSRIATLDRRHFAVVRPAHTEAFELLP